LGPPEGRGECVLVDLLDQDRAQALVLIDGALDLEL
jgi:hypothetical protein